MRTMATNYLQFSDVLELTSPRQGSWLVKYLAIIDCDESTYDPPNEDSRILRDLKAEAEELGAPEAYVPIYDCWADGLSGPLWSFTQHGHLHVYSEERAELSGFACLVRLFLLRFGIKEPFCLQWAELCDKMRRDEFGGGAMVVFPHEIRWLSTAAWIQEQLSG